MKIRDEGLGVWGSRGLRVSDFWSLRVWVLLLPNTLQYTTQIENHVMVDGLVYLTCI